MNATTTSASCDGFNILIEGESAEKGRRAQQALDDFLKLRHGALGVGETFDCETTKEILRLWAELRAVKPSDCDTEITVRCIRCVPSLSVGVCNK